MKINVIACLIEYSKKNRVDFFAIEALSESDFYVVEGSSESLDKQDHHLV